ncbi:MAG: hypothetical protein QOE71_2202, partial [Pseudonocardiales bacterium]|nr:hypothetical protein [Pseudonocardiales bacterium]
MTESGNDAQREAGGGSRMTEQL